MSIAASSTSIRQMALVACALFMPLIWCSNAEGFAATSSQGGTFLSSVQANNFETNNFGNLRQQNVPQDATSYRTDQRQDQTRRETQLPGMEIFKVDSSNEQNGTLVLFNNTFNETLEQPTRKKVTDFVFPGKSNRPNDGKPNCEENHNKLFCENVHNYPTQAELDALLQHQFSKYKVFFGEDMEVQPLNVTQRINYEPDEQCLCDIDERLVYPKEGLTKDNSSLLIVNNEQYKQGVRIEECKNEGQKCRFMSNLQNGYTAYCKQNYIYRSLVAISADKKIVNDKFKLPSCCKCIVKPN